MKITVYLPIFILALLGGYLAGGTSALAEVPDIYETPPGGGISDDTDQGAHLITVGKDPTRQHTLHTRTDVDWFKFRGIPGTAAGRTDVERTGIYTIRAVPGTDINLVFEIYLLEGTALTFIERVNTGFYQGNPEETKFVPEVDGTYYIKVYDFEGTEPPSDCRINIQYTLKIIETDAGDVPYDISGVVTDYVSGVGIPNASLHLACENRTHQSFGGGHYAFTDVKCNTGLLSIRATASGYRPVSCHFPVLKGSAGILEYTRNIKMMPTSEALPSNAVVYRNPNERLFPSKSSYTHNETLNIRIPWTEEASTTGVPSDECVAYYFAFTYPPNGQRIEVIPHRNQIQGAQLVPWSGQGGDTVWHKSTAGMPVGQYSVYLLRMPAYNNPNTQMHLGELTQPRTFTIY